MSLQLVTGLFIQAVALVMVLSYLRGRWLSHTGALFVIMACIFYGLTEIVQLLFPRLNSYRKLINQEYIDSWVLLISVAVLLFALFYIYTLRHLERRPAEKPEPALAKPVLDWKAMLVITLPLYMFALTGALSNSTYWLSGLTGQFLFLGISLTAIAILLLVAEKYIYIVIIFQSIALALMLKRLYILISLVVVLSTLRRFKVNIGYRSFIFSFIVFVALAAAISSSRMDVSYYRNLFTEGKIGERVSTLVSGAQDLTRGVVGNDAFVEDFVYRFDGNTFGALIYERMRSGTESAGLEPFWNNFMLVIPSFIYQSKMSTSDISRDEKLFMDVHYGLPARNGIYPDYLPTTFGIIFGYYGPAVLLAAAALLGFIFARLDYWLNRSKTLISLLVGVGLTYCVITMEQGVVVYFVVFRGIISIYLFLLGYNFVKGLVMGNRSASVGSRVGEKYP